MIIRRIILSFIISAAFITNLTAFTLQDSIHTLPEFRGKKWDSSLNEVKEKETAYYLQTFHGFGIEALSYKGKIAGLDARIDYDFKNNKLIESSYRIISDDNFKEDYSTLFNFLGNLYGKPDLRSGISYESDSVWIKTTDYNMYIGPSIYWVFNNGFIGLISQKYKEEITLIVLYVHNITIEEYNSGKAVELKNYKIIKY